MVLARSHERTFMVSLPTMVFMKTSFCLHKPVENSTRRAWLEKFGLPEGDEARCLRMDSLIKGELGKETMDADKKLARLQNFTLDAAGPLVVALEEVTTKDEPNSELIVAALQQSLMLVGNASAHGAGEVESRPKSLAEDEDFSQTQPLLFGKGFEKKAKERAEALECLRKASIKERKNSIYSTSNSKCFLRGSRPQQNGGYRGGNYHRQTNWTSDQKTTTIGGAQTSQVQQSQRLKEHESGRLTNSVNKSKNFFNKVNKQYSTGEINNTIKGLGKGKPSDSSKPIPHRQASITLPELGKNNWRSLGHTTNNGAQTGANQHPTTKQYSGGNTAITGNGTANVRRDHKADRQGGNSPIQCQQQEGAGFCVQNVS